MERGGGGREGGLDVRGEGAGVGVGDRKHKVAWKSLSFVESSVKGGREADVRPHTDNSTEHSVEFMRFNPLRNSREAAPPPSFPFVPHATGIRRLEGLGGAGPIPMARAARRRRRVQSARGRKPARVLCLTAKELALMPSNKTRWSGVMPIRV